MLIITARAWAMIDAVGEVCDCGDIGVMVTIKMVTMMMVVVDHLLPSDVELERLTAVP